MLTQVVQQSGSCGLAPSLAGAFFKFRGRSFTQLAEVFPESEEDIGLPEEIPEVFGYVHSTESFSAVDGPGVRFLTFLQGCAYRCVFCSNPDTWQCNKGPMTSSKQIAAKIQRVLPYLKGSGGGVTVSGGEALLQPQFTAALFREAHQMGISTCLDTTGQGTKHHSWDVVLPHTDVVLYCMKHFEEDRYFEITGHKMKGALKFVEELNEQWPDFGCEGIKVQRAHQPTSQCQDFQKFLRGKIFT
eukprot:TRINITY_DN4668_c1_g1_i5.p1 TRINITY_DN4668_c1_g1~~TRINITY_DN4668_c1_g1_i5.p1  ORF type:complete len:244 (+),score=38.63 TRINITY_DN4668_c1_g1_i5:220-951(+)